MLIRTRKVTGKPMPKIRTLYEADEVYLALFQEPIGFDQYQEKIFAGIFWSDEYLCPTCQRGVAYTYATCETSLNDLPKMLDLAKQVEEKKGLSWNLYRCSKENGWEKLDKEEYLKLYYHEFTKTQTMG